VAREWHYWSRNKLDILAGYLSAFNQASGSLDERIYLDLMAGQPENADAVTGERFDGSARIALDAIPGFTRHAFGELSVRNAASLEADLRTRHPLADFRVYPGDCNITIEAMLKELDPYRWAPTFAFLDQQAVELHWATLEKISAFRRSKKYKAEMWILCSPTMTNRGRRGTRGIGYGNNITRFYGTPDWLCIERALDEDLLIPRQFRAEMVNLLRWRLHEQLGYKHTVRIPMHMKNNLEIYDMVFATDNDAGLKIMSWLYGKAFEREPGMAAAAAAAKAGPPKYADDTLFDIDLPPTAMPTWQNEPAWDPRETIWWDLG